jgi:hypothetical protein
MLDKQGYMHARACTCARAHALARERASVLRYTYVICLVLIVVLCDLST